MPWMTVPNWGKDYINRPALDSREYKEFAETFGSRGILPYATDASYTPRTVWVEPKAPPPAPAPAPAPAPPPRATPQPRPQIGMLGGGGGKGYDKQFENMLRIFLPMLALQSRAGMYGLGGMMPQQPQADAGTFASRYNTPQGQAQPMQPMQPQGQATLGFRSRYGR